MPNRILRAIRAPKWLYGFVLCTTTAFAVPRKVIIDQDAFGPGGPNLQPILMVLQAPDIEVLGITIESGDGWQKENTTYALRMLELVGRPDIPVLSGATYPLVNSAEATRRWEAQYGKLVYKGAWTEEWPKEQQVRRRSAHGPEVVPVLEDGPPATKPGAETAASFLVRKVHEFPGQVTILALGPGTNLALAARLDDGFAAAAHELVMMGGSFNPQPGGTTFALEYLHTPRLEFNFRWDPEAARIVLHAPWRRIVLVPVDPTTPTLFTRDMIAKIAAADTPVARYVGKYAESFPLWDELGAAVWLDPGIVTRRQTLAVDVDVDHGAGYGSTLSWPAGQGPGLGEPNAEVVFAVDVPKLDQLIVKLLAGPAPPRRFP